MTILVNGKLGAQTSALDRGLLYGQSLFETIALHNGTACLLAPHLDRLERGCLAIGIPFKRDLLLGEITNLVQQTKKGVLRVTISMGSGGRGYVNPKFPEPTRILSIHEYPNHPTTSWEEGIELGLADIRLSHQPALAGLKHGNRLEQVIARSQWQGTWQEALLMDQQDLVIEGTQSNVFIVKGSELLTPELSNAGVAGVLRETIIQEAHTLGLPLKIMSLCVDEIEAADEVFLTNSIIGLWPVRKFRSKLYNGFEISHKLLKILIKNEIIPHYKT